MTIDPSNGWLWFVFYDRRSYDSDSTDVYMALSRDGGETFKNFKVSEQPFTPSKLSFFGDYTHITAANNVVRPIWTAMNTYGQKSIYTALVNIDALHLEVAVKGSIEGVSLSKDIKQTSFYPNPADNQLFVRFDKRCSGKLSLRLYDADGKNVATVFEKKRFKKGQHETVIELQNYNLPSGAYTYKIESKRGKVLATNGFVKK